MPVEKFATDFLTDALTGGADLLITSLPLVGLNAIPDQPLEPLFVRTRDHIAPTNVDPALLSTFPQQHDLFEVIDDPDHYMHFFIDGAVRPAALASTGPVVRDGSVRTSRRSAGSLRKRASTASGWPTTCGNIRSWAALRRTSRNATRR